MERRIGSLPVAASVAAVAVFATMLSGCGTRVTEDQAVEALGAIVMGQNCATFTPGDLSARAVAATFDFDPEALTLSLEFEFTDFDDPHSDYIVDGTITCSVTGLVLGGSEGALTYTASGAFDGTFTLEGGDVSEIVIDTTAAVEFTATVSFPPSYGVSFTHDGTITVDGTDFDAETLFALLEAAE